MSILLFVCYGSLGLLVLPMVCMYGLHHDKKLTNAKTQGEQFFGLDEILRAFWKQLENYVISMNNIGKSYSYSYQ